MTYAKSVLAIVVAGISAAIVALTGDNAFSNVELINIAIAVVTAAAVFTGPNVPGAAVTKMVLAVLGAVLTLAVNLIVGGLSLSEWLQLAVAAAGAIGVYAVPNNTGPNVVQ